MSSTRKPLPPPDVSGIAPNAVLRKRFSVGSLPPQTNPFTPDLQEPPSQVQEPIGDVQVSTGGVQEPAGKVEKPVGDPAAPKVKKTRGARPDAPGMGKVTLYLSETAIAGLEAAAKEVMEVLKVPKNVALTELITRSSLQSAEVIQEMLNERAQVMKDRLKSTRRAEKS